MRYLIVILIMCFSFSAFGEKTIPVFRGVKKGEPSPVTGVAMNEATAIKVAKERVELKDLKQTIEIEKKLWDFKEKEYLNGLKKADKEIQKLSKVSWWTENKVWVGLVLGFVAGSTTAILMYKTASATK